MSDRAAQSPKALALPQFLRPLLAPAAAAALTGLALLSLVDTFRHHLTPDTTVYLLHARTWLDEGNRFVSSFDSKGPLLALALAPAVRALGATAAAAAASQAFAYLAAAIALYALVRRFAGRAEAVLFSSLGVLLGCSPFLWGAVARPENFAFGAVAISLWAGTRRGAAWRAAGGALAGVLLFTKLTLALTPLAITLAALWRDSAEGGAESSPQESALRSGAAALGGFALVCGAVLAWLAAGDSLAGWYRQCIAWPRETRAVGGEQMGGVSGVLGLLRNCGLDYLLFVSLAGVVRGWRAGHRRLATLAVAGIGAEWLRMTGEGAVWHYLPTAGIAPLLLGAALLGAREPSHARGARPFAIAGWIVPLLALAPWLLPQARAEMRAFQLRTIAHAQSPDEFLVERLRPLYRSGETMLVQGNGYAPLLLLGAPRPAPVLPLDYARVSPAEQTATRAFYARRAPDWVVRMAPAVPMPPGQYRGSTDWAYFVQSAAPEADTTKHVAETGDAIAPMLPHGSRYTLAFDTGWAEVWRLESAVR
ncbi:MAG: hypothetical protein IPJ04_02080 [Candidatus Eisenbacteria bacterium]|nr:hypothetical protein [Candidatus Eisenbacteria bacterium]